MQKFLRKLKCFKSCLTRQELKTLRGQALAGDVAGAYKGLEKLLNRKGVRT